MADLHLNSFEERNRRIVRRHKKMANGYVTSINQDGLIVAHPRRRAPNLPWKGFALTVVLFLLFKGFLYANLGPITYGERVDKLNQGTIVEQAGAFLMQADSVTIWFANEISRLVY
ncbi:hypothetical protein ACFFUT_02095 [Pseudohalocynthiibacter aestuariivivens]|jgi:hypothetical protein|uniref:Uncharacterized protein n=1 Tax=Pseudohalocynthiibacter aestuariivivens TaxID=1591409 RepID=A0ABV5JAU4_9RHOB|nr:MULTISPECIES: hypothetical protein [Pseudohalocynthiibacter]MBS9715869.1 hypothetical protein [Pseudohalocynthiibacter aestuariivivens]MCK0101482.1 hypothetical protein [Pseudohalocynthiibacter sp. F2068]